MEKFGVALCVIAFIGLIYLLGYTIYTLFRRTGVIIYITIICLAIGGAIMMMID